MSLVQKIVWAAEVLKLGVAVFWTDMDITYFSNPMKWVGEAAMPWLDTTVSQSFNALGDVHFPP